MSRSAVVIGGQGGIGQALQARLERKDWQVTEASRRSESALDVTEDEPNFPEPPATLHGLVYCPGTINLRPFSALQTKDFLDDFDVNVLGAVKSIRFYLQALKASESASVVLFSTVAVHTGMPFHSSVAASKGAVEGLGRALAAELAPEVRVNVIAPSLTDTPLASRLLRSEKQREAAAERHPLKRIGRAEDAAALADFLLSEDSSWITGQVLTVDGGIGALRTL